MEPILELKGITKSFPGVLANDNINLTLNKGEIHALLGENGAGKSTLMNVLYGLYSPDKGEIFVNGQKIEVSSPRDAIAQGIGMVHQHFMLIPVFTVTDNVMLGDETIRSGVFLDRKTPSDRIREISDEYSLEVDPNSYIRDLPVGVQQRVEIIKLLYREADILILDEPTAVLTPQEVDELFTIMRSLVESGKSIIFITHKLREVLTFADRITVIRGGKVVGTTTPAEADQNQLAAMMVGRDVSLELDKKPAEVRDVILTAEDLVILDDLDNVAVKKVSLEVRGGEILGIAGVQGNGQTELVKAITGLTHPLSGKITLLDQDITKASPRTITEIGSAHIPEDRQRDGLVLNSPITDNMVLNTYYLDPFAKGVIIQEDVVLRTAVDIIENFDVRTPSPLIPVGTLSGGNQQKVIVGREFSRPIQFLVAAQPTRGLDVGSIEYIHNRLLEKRDDGVAILLVSTELDEIMELSDRIAVMFAGEIIAIVDAKSVTKEQIGLLMAGVKETE
jgi:simple sugar transport system ATP-binding protein